MVNLRDIWLCATNTEDFAIPLPEWIYMKNNGLVEQLVKNCGIWYSCDRKKFRAGTSCDSTTERDGYNPSAGCKSKALSLAISRTGSTIVCAGSILKP